MNYLILTPDGVGSTYLQRALTVYLNSSGSSYYNTHELLNGLELDQDNNLYKEFKGYDQSVSEIALMLNKNTGNIVSRLAEYHVDRRLKGRAAGNPITGENAHHQSPEVSARNRTEDYSELYATCNSVFDKIVYCTRDTFEYSLSWSIRKLTGTLNVYSVSERMNTHGDSEYTVDTEFMSRKLKQYDRYLTWVHDNFPNAIAVDYADMHTNIDGVLQDITGLDYAMKDDWGISLQEHSTMLYKLSSLFNPVLDYSDNLVEYTRSLIVSRRMITGIPVKMNTLADKRNKVTNFDACVDAYNTFARTSNQHTVINKSDIAERILTENNIYNAQSVNKAVLFAVA